MQILGYATLQQGMMLLLMLCQVAFERADAVTQVTWPPDLLVDCLLVEPE